MLTQDTPDQSPPRPRGGCTKGMRRCAATCGHRAIVEDYRLARYSAEQARDAVTQQYPAEEALFHEEHGPLITFKDWLIGLAQDKPDVVTTLPEPVLDSVTAAAWEAA